MIEYENQWFVNRTPEISLVQGKVEWLLDDRLVEKRTIIFTGEHGVGKTWLLLHLWRLFRADVRLKTYYLDLTRLTDRTSPQESLRQICQDFIAKVFGETRTTDMAPEEQARRLIQEVKQDLLPKQPFVIFVDSVYESGPTLLGILENYLLAPLAAQRRVLLVMAGRGQAYPWREAELRLRAEFITLEPFTVVHTREQLERQLPAMAAQVNATFALSSGNPKANWWLASHENRPEAIDQIIDEMLTPIDPTERARVRADLQAVAIPHMFDESTVPLLLEAYANDTHWRRPSRQQIRQICDAMLRPGLIFWNTDAGGYTLHPATRSLILRYLCAAEHERWVRLHTTMFTLYADWLRDDPQNRSLWQAEMDYHAASSQNYCP